MEVEDIAEAAGATTKAVTVVEAMAAAEAAAIVGPVIRLINSHSDGVLQNKGTAVVDMAAVADTKVSPPFFQLPSLLTSDSVRPDTLHH